MKLRLAILGMTLWLAFNAGTAESQTALEAARSYRDQHGADILRDFATLLALPNVASDSSGIRKNASYLVTQFAKRGAAMELLELPGAPPVVYGRLDAPGARQTLGIYVHYDGQPVDASTWTRGPWTPSLFTEAIEAGGKPRDFPAPGETMGKEWRLYARSAGDDKAPFVAWLTAIDALEAAGLTRTSNLLFLFEGEEEAGSPHLGEYLETFAERFPVDAWLFCDGPVHQSRKMQLVFGVRGVTGLDITLYGAVRGLHSGHYGNWAPNPAMDLARLLASMKDDVGNVSIEGFYDSMEPLSDSERQALHTVPELEGDLARELGLARTEGKGTLTESILFPALNVNGLASAQVGDKSRNVIPATATATLDIRLVKGNVPEHMLDLVEAHIRKQGYFIVREDPDMTTRLAHGRIAKVVRKGGYPAVRTSMDHPFVQRLVEAARNATAGDLVLMPSMGGSLPLYLFTQRWDVPVVIVPIANHDDNQHAADENLRVANLWDGIDLMGAILTMNSP